MLVRHVDGLEESEEWEQSPTAFLERWGCDESLEGDDSDEDDDEDADDVEDQHSTGSAHMTSA